MTPNDALGLFLKPVRDWFTATLGSPTEAQCLAWPAITAGQNALLLAPTGSGKTLAAFLACLDRLWRQPKSKGVKILYLSPLKALNNDIDRNLRLPLAGVTEAARTVGTELRTLTSAVRTGDTPARQRQEHLRNPPEIFITTPESLHLLLTSRGQDILESVETVIIDEIHACISFLASGTPRMCHPKSATKRPAAAAHWPVRHATPARRHRPLPRRRHTRFQWRVDQSPGQHSRCGPPQIARFIGGASC